MIFGVHVSFPGILLVKVGSWPQQRKQKQPQHQVIPSTPNKQPNEKSNETANQISWGNNLCVSGSNSSYHVIHDLRYMMFKSLPTWCDFDRYFDIACFSFSFPCSHKQCSLNKVIHIRIQTTLIYMHVKSTIAIVVYSFNRLRLSIFSIKPNWLYNQWFPSNTNQDNVYMLSLHPSRQEIEELDLSHIDAFAYVPWAFQTFWD